MKQPTFSILVACLILGSCSADPNNTQQNVEAAKASFASFNAHDWVAHADFFSDNCQFLDPSIGKEHKTLDRKTQIAKYQRLQNWSPDITDSITSIFGHGDKVTIQFISSGTTSTDSSSVEWQQPMCCVFTYKDGLIVVDETYYDRSN